MKQLPCLRNMASSKHWMPEQEPEPGTEVKSGDLYLLSPSNGNSCRTRTTRYPVHVKVYRSCYGHYAVVTASLRSPATYLNLRTCTCRPCSVSDKESSDNNKVSKFRVEMGGGEGQVIYFEVSTRDQAEVEEWIGAFQGTVCSSPGRISPSLSPIIPRSPIMPTLQESLEEEEEEEANGLG